MMPAVISKKRRTDFGKVDEGAEPRGDAAASAGCSIYTLARDGYLATTVDMISEVFG
jgi:hypothetical protein